MARILPAARHDYTHTHHRRPCGWENDSAWQPNQDDAYSTRQWGGTDIGFDAGYRDGITLGQQDQMRRTHGDYRRADAYRNGDPGYRTNYCDPAQYQQRFRDASIAATQDASGRSRYLDESAYHNNANRDNAGILGTRGVQGSGAASATIAVPVTVSGPRLKRFPDRCSARL